MLHPLSPGAAGFSHRLAAFTARRETSRHYGRQPCPAWEKRQVEAYAVAVLLSVVAALRLLLKPLRKFESGPF